MDHVVLKRVTGRDFEPFRKRLGILKGFKRMTVRKCNYPAILESKGNEVGGIVVDGITTDVVERLDAFEDTTYERKNVIVGLGNGSTVNAEAYVAGSEMLLDDVVWDFDLWYQFHRSEFLRRLTF